MAPRANWKGFLRLSLVTCPVALYPATSDSEKISFNQINKNTGHRIRYLRVDADPGRDSQRGSRVRVELYACENHHAQRGDSAQRQRDDQ